MASRNPLAVDARLLGLVAAGVWWKGRKAAEGVSLRRRRITTRGLSQGMGRRRSLPPFQQSHPARFVAGAGNLWHASAHKGSPLFRRWAPAPSTVHPEGSPGGSFPAVSKAPGDPSEPTEAHPISSNRIACGSWRNCLLALQPRAARRARRCRRERHAGECPADCGAPPRRQGRQAKTWGSVPISSPWTVIGVVYVTWCDVGPRIRRARCPCNRGIGRTTRKRRSYCCAGASSRRIPGRPVLPAARSTAWCRGTAEPTARPRRIACR